MKFGNVLSCVLMLVFVAGCGGTDEENLVPPPVETTCGPSNCNGCCIENHCYTGDSGVACGTNGAQCAQCRGINECTSARQCVQNLAAQWLLQPASAALSPTDPNDGLSWDADDSAPDVVVEITCPSAAGGQAVAQRTPEVSSLQPTWITGGCTSTVDSLLGAPLSIKVIDIDSFIDDEIASFSVELKPEYFDAGGIIVSLPNGVGTLTLSLSRQSTSTP